MGAKKDKPDSDEAITTARDALRRDYPRIGVLYDGWTGRWKAVWGQHGYADASSAHELRQQLQQTATAS